VAQYYITAFDLIGDLSFGEKFGCLDKADYVPFVGATKAIAKELTFTQMFIYYGLMGVRRYFMPKHIAGTRAQNMKRAIDTVERRIERNTDRKDFLYYILAANDEKGMSRAEIHVNSFSFNIAGSESSATSLSGITFYILTHLHAYQKLVDEIRAAYSSEDEINISSVNNLGYLEAVVLESLRLYPPVPGTLPRVVPAGGETIDGAYVPAGTTVGVNHYSCSRHPKNFYRHDDFLPERWLPETRDAAPFDQDNRACTQPFSFGPRNCLGKNLARAEMRLVMAKLLWRYDLELMEGNANWQKEQKVFGFWVKGPLKCRLTAVKRD
jgi:cytochrome P450